MMLRVAIAVIRRGGRFFLQRRDTAAPRFPGLWEFPGGKVEGTETPIDALLRELREEVAWAPDRLEPMAVVRHSYSDLQVELNPFLCEGVSCPGTNLAWGWFRPREMALLPMPEANLQILRMLELPGFCD